ncbi:MAG: transposase [Clostridiales bacterium]|nr:transposase [Clostridiales bacterium]
MPRYCRQKSQLGIYHVMIRGVGQMNIFHDDEDRRRFMSILLKIKGENNFELYSYSLMPNHLHLLIKEVEDSISRIMKRFGVSYVYHFNQKYNRVGHLFQDRFRSEIIDTEQYFLGCSRYIHNNSVAAGLAQHPEDYPWSSYTYYMNEHDDNKLLNKDFLLDHFSVNRAEAILKLKEFTECNNMDEYLECDDIVPEPGLKRIDWQDALAGILEKHKINLEELRTTRNKSKRNAVLQEIKVTSKLSTRELSRLLGISKDTIFRA